MIGKKILKKISLIVLVFFVLMIIYILGNRVNVVANEGKENINKITDDTVITKDNIYQILDFLQIEYTECEMLDIKEDINKYTVKELKNAIDKINNNASEIILEENINYQTEDIYSDEIITKKDKVINKQLSRTSQQDGYVVDFYVNVQYNKTKKKYTKTTGQGADVDGEIPLLEFKIGSKSLTSSCTANSVNLKGKVKVNIYIGVGGIGLLKIKENEIKVNYNW